MGTPERRHLDDSVSFCSDSLHHCYKKQNCPAPLRIISLMNLDYRKGKAHSVDTFLSTGFLPSASFSIELFIQEEDE